MSFREPAVRKDTFGGDVANALLLRPPYREPRAKKPKLSDLEKARIWQEGWDHYRNHFSPMFPEYGKNPYLEEGP